MNVQKVVGTVRENLRKHGARAALHDLGYRALNRIMDLQVLRGMCVRMQDVKDPGLFDARGLDARFVGESELASFAGEGRYEFSAEFLREARERGDRCYALFDGDALAAYGWYSGLPTPVDGHFVLHFDPEWTYMYKGYTVPAYRGKRLHAVGMCRALQAFTDEGRRGLISYVASNNFASLQSVTRMGYRIFGDVYLIRAAGCSCSFATPGCKAYGFRVEPLRTGGALAKLGV